MFDVHAHFLFDLMEFNEIRQLPKMICFVRSHFLSICLLHAAAGAYLFGRFAS